MELEKKYVPVTVHFDANGKMRPIEIEFDEMRRYHIDTNEHVNNCEYIRTFMSATGAVDMPRRIRAEYRQAAVMGDIFHPYVYKDDARCIADLRGEDGTSYAVVEFIYEKE